MATKYAKQTFITVPNRNTLQTVSPHAQAVFLWLCAMQDSAGRSFPSHSRLAQLTKQSARSVIRKLQELEASGLITKANQYGDKGQTSNLYEIMIVDVEPVLEPQEMTADTMTDSHPPYDTVSPPPDICVTPPVTDSHPARDSQSHRTKTKRTKPTLTKTKELKASAAGLAKASNRPARDDAVATLYFQVITALAIPKTNVNNIFANINKLKAEIPEDEAIKYLTFMRDHYKGAAWDYKPQVTEALQIYSKRVAIITSLQEHTKRQQESVGVVI